MFVSELNVLQYQRRFFYSNAAKWTWRGDEKEVVLMRQMKSKKECEHPEKLKGKPGECTPEQIRECHGDVKGHPCVSKK